MESSFKSTNNGYQNVVVMRHGDRIDKLEPLWISTATRPWDPPLNQDGKDRAFRTGQKIRRQVEFPIHRIFVSPSLRCIQTANEVITALSAVDFNPESNDMSSNDVVSIDKSKLKVAIEFGLCEMLNTMAIKPEVVPKDKNFDFKISNLESMLPDGMVDLNVHRVYKEMPQWEETLEECTNRYVYSMKTLADQYPLENLLLITHGRGIRAILSMFTKNANVCNIEYCACLQLKRQVFSENGCAKVGDFEMISGNDHFINRLPV